MRLIFPQALTLKRAFVSLLLVFSFLTQLACDRQEAINLSKVGVETSTTLFSFYETLAQNTNDTRELQILWMALSAREDRTARAEPGRTPPTVPVNTNGNSQVPNNAPVTNGRNHAPSRQPASTRSRNQTPGAYLAPAVGNSRTPATRPATANVNANPRPSAAPTPQTARRRGPQFPDDHPALMLKRVQALRSRAIMARHLANFLTTLKTYSESDPGEKVEEAANKLGDTVASLIPVPGVEAAVPLLAGFAGDLKRWQQHKKIKDQMKVVQAGLSKLREFYDREAGAYTSIAQENNVFATAVLQELIKLEMVTTWGVFEKLPKPYGMRWTDVVDEPEKREHFKKAFIEIIRFRNERFMANAKGATENLQEALAEFDGKITDFLNKKTITWDSAQAALERAKFYLNEINNMRNAKEDE